MTPIFENDRYQFWCCPQPDGNVTLTVTLKLSGGHRSGIDILRDVTPEEVRSIATAMLAIVSGGECKGCFGEGGWLDDSGRHVCPSCGGTGKWQGCLTQTLDDNCPECGGCGLSHYEKGPCDECGGSGRKP